MLRFFAACFFAFVLVSSASAQTIIKNLNPDTVFKSMQCEIGLFAQKAKAIGLDPSLKAHVKYSTTGSYEAKASAEAGFGGWLATIIQGPKLSAAYDFSRVDGNTLEGKLNVNQGNTATCVGRRPALPVGIDDCLTTNQTALKNGFTATCTKKVTAKATFDASGKFSFWVVTIGPDFSGGITVTYEMDIDAPAADDKKVAQN
jgi:hypothetical protein